MKAIIINENKKLVWSDVPDPITGADDVLVKVHYAAVNRADIMQCAGDYPPPDGCPDWPGLEVSGEIIKGGSGKKRGKNGMSATSYAVF